MRGSMGKWGTGGSVPPPPPLENYKAIGFLRNTGPYPWKITTLHVPPGMYPAGVQCRATFL